MSLKNLIPELEMFDLLQTVTEFLAEDLATATSDEETFLYEIIGRSLFKGEDYFLMAKELFARNEKHPNRLAFFLSFTGGVNSLPSISIQVPTDNPDESMDSLGAGVGSDHTVNEDESVQDVLNNTFSSSLNLVIASKNIIELTIIYTVYRALLITLEPVLDLMGFQKPKLSGREVVLNSEIVNTNLYSRVLVLSFSQTVFCPSMESYPKIKDLIFSGKPYKFE